jgi:hypothetical protein
MNRANQFYATEVQQELNILQKFSPAYFAGNSELSFRGLFFTANCTELMNLSVFYDNIFKSRSYFLNI